MIVRKTLLAASAAVLMSTPAWAIADNNGNGHAPTTPVGPPKTTPSNTDNPGSSHRNSSGDHGRSGDRSRRCRPHAVGYVASGTLVKETLAQDKEASTYSGEVTIKVTSANHHAALEKGGTLTLKVEKVRLVLGMADTNNDGTVGLDDVKEGDRVTLIGRITTLAKRCSHKDFTSKLAVRQVVVNAPEQSTSSSS
jgi:hypothetical protein